MSNSVNTSGLPRVGRVSDLRQSNRAAQSRQLEVLKQLLKELYRVRLRFKEIFDTARDRTIAARWLRQLRQRLPGP